MGERYENIDYTKGLAVTLVVVMHAFACAGYLSRASSGAMEGFGPIDDAGKSSKGGNIAVTTKRFGDGYLLQALQRRLRPLDDLIRRFGEEDGKLIMAVAMAYTIHPGALMHMEDVLTKSTYRSSSRWMMTWTSPRSACRS